MAYGNDRLVMVYNVWIGNQLNAFSLNNQPFCFALRWYNLHRCLVDIVSNSLRYMIEEGNDTSHHWMLLIDLNGKKEKRA